MPTSIDLDAARAARLEAEGERSFTFRGERFSLPDELPYELLEPIGRLGANERDMGALRDVIAALLGEDAHERFVALRPSLPDLNELVGRLFGEYGLTPSAEGGAAGDPKSPPSSGQ